MQTPGPLDENLATMIPCNRDPGLRRTLRAAILEEVNSTESRLRSLYAQLNALVPVSLLPTELLSRIFHLLRDEPDYRDDMWLPSPITVAHVCRHWREVALSDSSLWSAIRDHVPKCSQKWLTEMLIRSKKASLEISLYSPRSRFLRSLISHSSRISKLSLLGLGDGGAMQGLLEMEAPLLEDLHMRTLTTATQPIMVSHDPPVSTSGFRLFHRQSSKLRKIYLYNIHIPWVYFPKCTLTHLTINTESPSTTEVLRMGTLGDLVDVIASSPCLEQLALDHCIAPISSQPTLAETVIELPRLRRLDLSGPSSSVLHIFQSLHVPALRDLVLLFVATSQAETASWPTIAPSILARFHRTGSVIAKALRLEVDGDRQVMKVGVEGRSSLATPATPSLSIDETFVSLEFENQTRDNQDYYEVIWEEACMALHMVELETLYITSIPTIHEPELWTQLFKQCDNVTRVYAEYPGTKSLLRSMKPRGPTPSGSSQDLDEPTPALLFPKLTYLSLEDLDFDRMMSYDTGERFYELISELLKHRKHRGVPVRELCISRCNVSSTEASSLASLVPKIRWDRNEDV
ncbi:hypothetical protein BC834DRAFT_1033349 [Gloeopeniophorella convolvens]|nr:hypothetical protein BC834DRAFT_1033349 [Gloeopeniophorella convolvens]